MKLTYSKQRELDAPIEAIIAAVGCCRGRIEILNGDNQVIEFETNEKGKWSRTGWYCRAGDDAFSIFDEFKVAKRKFTISDLLALLPKVGK